MKEGIIVAGAAAGAAIPLILREYLDQPPSQPPSTAGFDWKKPSALVGIGGGAALTLLGLFGHRWLGDTIATFASAAGPAMIVTGVYSAMFPKVPPTPAARAARLPTIRIAPPETTTSPAGIKTY